MEGSEQRRMSRKIPKSHERNSKDVKRKDNGDAHSGGSIGDNTAEVKRKSEDHRSRRIHSTDSKMCPPNVSLKSKEKTGGNCAFFRDNCASVWRKMLNRHFLEK